VVRAIVDHVTALAQALQIAPPVIARVVIEMRCSQDHAGAPDLRDFDKVGPAGGPAATIAPGTMGRIEPATIGQQRTATLCGRPHPWQTPAARSKRSRWLICDQPPR